jgi:hypothetical protein
MTVMQKTNRRRKFFSDNNAAWLKPKQKQINLSSETRMKMGPVMMIVGGDGDDSDEEMEVERRSRLSMQKCRSKKRG